jgi:hypothetical protein
MISKIFLVVHYPISLVLVSSAHKGQVSIRGSCSDGHPVTKLVSLWFLKFILKRSKQFIMLLRFARGSIPFCVFLSFVFLLMWRGDNRNI